MNAPCRRKTGTATTRLLVIVFAIACAGNDGDAPEAPPADVVKAALAHPGFRWDSVTTADYTLYAPRESYAASHLAEYGTATREAIARDLGMLGEDTMPAHMRVFHVGSRAEMKMLAGGTYSGYADAGAFGVVLVAVEGSRPVHRHEIMHALSLRLWGHPGTNGWTDPEPSLDGWRQGSWLREGLAAAAEDLCGLYSYRGIAAQMEKEKVLFPLDTLRETFTQQDDLMAYIQAGSLVQFLLATYGRPRFRELWRDGGRNIQSIYDVSAQSIESGWHEWLAATTDSRPESVAAFRARGCEP